MTSGSWLDHLPPWLAWGAIASTGAYSPAELGLMAAPLLLAAVAQLRTTSLLRWRRLLEFTALAGFLAQVVARAGLLPTVVNTLFLLCAVRLALPRELPQRRQLLLMGFLLFLTTAISTSELDFLVWSLLWIAGAALVLLEQNWGKSALLRRGPLPAPPYRLVLPWTVAVVILAAGMFVLMPRLRLGWRGLPVGVQGLKGVQAGLSEVLELAGKGPIQSNREVALRVLPASELSEAQRGRFARATALLRCFVLEELEDQRWAVTGATPPRTSLRWGNHAGGTRPLAAEFLVAPTLRGILPLPYGEGELAAVSGEELRFGPGSAVRVAFPQQRTTAIQVALSPALAAGPGEASRIVQKEAPPSGQRLARLTDPGLSTGAALRWSLRAAPGELPPQALAQRLTEALRTFSYTLDNPSGDAANPLADFLERTRAGHCEYFASALALMLRHRGVPSRIANGYRLGPWSAEGGYFLVTQGEAHSWVEYYDAASGGWRVADPTPPAPPFELGASELRATLTRWTDALRFRWERHVMRFSDQDQLTGLTWLQGKTQSLARWQPRRPSPWLLAGAGLALLAWVLRGTLRRRQQRSPGSSGAGRIRALAPLLRKTRHSHPPLPGETASAWLARLAQARPARAEHLAALAREADAVAYGQQAPATLKTLAKAEARAWEN